MPLVYKDIIIEEYSFFNNLDKDELADIGFDEEHRHYNLYALSAYDPNIKHYNDPNYAEPVEVLL
jgi:hypothetical protein